MEICRNLWKLIEIDLIFACLATGRHFDFSIEALFI
jgi:hypothetical protein